MKKLFKFKHSVTLPAAAQYLATVFEGEVTVADVLQLGLDGHLRLSFNFVNKVRARRGKYVPIEEARLQAYSTKDGKISGTIEAELRVGHVPTSLSEGVKSGEVVLVVRGIDIGDGRVLELDDEVDTLDGIWDLPMIGAERLDVEHMVQQETNGPEVTLIHLNGPFVTNQTGELWQLLEHFSRNPYYNDRQSLIGDGSETGATSAATKSISHKDSNSYYPAPGLPNNGVIVVRTGALADFADRIAGNSLDRPVETRERVTLLTIIAALAKHAKIDIARPSKAAELIQKLTIDVGARISVRTIEEHLKRIGDALERRNTDSA